VSGWARLARAHELVIVGGLCELDAEGVVRNSAVLVDGDGVRAVYRKAHLWDRERLVFAAGSDAPPVVDVAIGRIGVMVCYDLEFPEWVRQTASPSPVRRDRGRRSRSWRPAAWPMRGRSA
jgi:5-aminopentanamidase